MVKMVKYAGCIHQSEELEPTEMKLIASTCQNEHLTFTCLPYTMHSGFWKIPAQHDIPYDDDGTFNACYKKENG
jgi:hypothetical protein